MDFKAEVNGWKQLSKLLDDLPERLQRKVVNSAASAGAQVIVKEAKKNVRQNGSVKTGTLLNSIRKRKKKRVHGIYEVFTDKSAPHAHLVEFGTGPRSLKQPKEVQIKGTWRTITQTGSMPAKPFFRPAVDENHNLVMRKIAERMAKRMATEAEKMSRDYRTLSKSYRKQLAK